MLLDNETALSHAAVERQRCIGTLDSLQVEISEELGEAHSGQEEVAHLVVAGAEAGGGAAINGMQVVWPTALRRPEPHVAGGSSNGHTVDTAGDLQTLERRVYALKARLSRIGPVNPLAMEEFTSLSERHAYLQTQLGDLSAAGDSLRRVIAELDRAMRDQFAATFEQVNEKFQHFFSLLFAGGTARLELTNPQDAGQSGIEISAQPPGKRMQPLAALSGGERALTSAALLFALLKVRPVPFCVLDEVDAALDESNVTRFRSALQELGERTQFVIITHNRGTIEAANTMYGVSMAGDGTSQLLSLKVED
jgi:chromosome segregation protein